MALILLSALAEARASEATLRDSIMDDARILIRHGDVDGFDRLATAFRDSRERTPAGISKLSLVYYGLDGIGPTDPSDPEWARLETIAADWLSADPDSPTAVIVAAKLSIGHAWAFRGPGYANTVTADRFPPYNARIEQARELLDRHRDVAASDPEWHALRIGVASQQGTDHEAILALAESALPQHGYYLPIHFAAATAMLPKWGGSEELVQRYVRIALRYTEPGDGQQIYGRIYFHLARRSDSPINVLNLTGAHWPQMKRSYDEILRAYPDRRNSDAFHGIACLAGVRETYAALGRWAATPSESVAYWDTAQWRVKCDQWAFEGKTFSRPLLKKIENYRTFLAGYGRRAWEALGLLVIALELVLLRFSRPAPEVRQGPTYPRRYRLQLSGISIAASVRMIVYGIALAIMLAATPELDTEVFVVQATGIAVSLTGAGLVTAAQRRYITLHANTLELHGLMATQILRRDEIGTASLVSQSKRHPVIELRPKDPRRRPLLIRDVWAPDAAFWQWFEPLPGFRAAAPAVT
ncbi:MAG: hypothetical protein WC809_22000 [Sinimarinibacterium sp.]